MEQLELWQQEVRKIGGDYLVKVVTELRDGQKEIIHRLETMDTNGTKGANSAISKINQAFYNGDFEGHRRYHEAVIEKTAEVRRLRIAIQEKTISGLIWAGIVGLGSLLWNNVKNGTFLGK